MTFCQISGMTVDKIASVAFGDLAMTCKALLLLIVVLTFPGCGPKYTYPSSTVPKSIENICRSEYNLRVKARVVGKTVGAVVYVNDLMDVKGQLPQEVHDKMGKVMQAVTRVALSTDLPVGFCTVVMRDRVHGAELTITRSLDDTKRANADAIGIEESMNRTLFSQGHFDAGSAKRDSFVLKDIRLEDFMAAQIVQRVRFGFVKDVKDEAARPFALVDGDFDDANGKRTFQFSIIGLKSSGPHESVLTILRTAAAVFTGYSFASFDTLEIQDYLNRQKLVVDTQTLSDYQNKRITEKELLDKCLIESQSIQDAFRLFGFNLPAESGEEAAKSVPTP